MGTTGAPHSKALVPSSFLLLVVRHLLLLAWHLLLVASLWVKQTSQDSHVRVILARS